MRLRSSRSGWGIGVCLAGIALLFTACAQPSAPPEPEKMIYVALGDSYAAMGSVEAGTTGPEFCLRATDNYPSQVMTDERVGVAVDASCQGAQIPDLLQPRVAGSGSLPPQVSTLDEDTDLVTLSIGGNDLGFGDIIGCVQRNLFSEPSVDCVAQLDAPVQERLSQLPAELERVYTAIAAATDGAQVITTGYLPILTDSQECPEVAGISAAERAWVAEITTQLNEVLGVAARNHDADFVLPEGFAEHSVCADPAQRWVDITGAQTGSYPMHPTAAGQAAMAKAVRAQL